MFRWLLKIDSGENPDNMCIVRVYGKRCNIAHRTSAPLVGCSTTRAPRAALPSNEKTGQGVVNESCNRVRGKGAAAGEGGGQQHHARTGA